MSIVLEQRKPLALLIYTLIFMFVFYAWMTSFLSENKRIEQVNIEIYSKTVPVEIGKPITIQVLVTDGNGLPVNNKHVRITLSDLKGTNGIISEKLPFIENGLYEGNIKFRSGGKWQVEAELEIGKNSFEYKSEFIVRGPILDNR